MPLESYLDGGGEEGDEASLIPSLGRLSTLQNDDDYDYAIELVPDDEYRKAAKILGNISDFEDADEYIENLLVQIDEEEEEEEEDEEGEGAPSTGGHNSGTSTGGSDKKGDENTRLAADKENADPNTNMALNISPDSSTDVALTNSGKKTNPSSPRSASGRSPPGAYSYSGAKTSSSSAAAKGGCVSLARRVTTVC